MISDDQLKQWQAIAAAATAGPWKVDDDRVCDGRCGDPIRYHDGSCCDHRSPVGCYIEGHHACGTIAREVESSDDSVFIAAAREAVPLLLAEVERLHALVRKTEVRR